jgi:hypothetical protein
LRACDAAQLQLTARQIIKFGKAREPVDEKMFEKFERIIAVVADFQQNI